MSQRKGWLVVRVEATDESRILETVRAFVGTRAEFRARSFIRSLNPMLDYAVKPITVDDPKSRPKTTYNVRRLPMDTTFEELEVMATSCVAGTLVSMRVQTPDGAIYHTPLSPSLRSAVGQLPRVRGIKLRATSVAKRCIHHFEILQTGGEQ